MDLNEILSNLQNLKEKNNIVPKELYDSLNALTSHIAELQEKTEIIKTEFKNGLEEIAKFKKDIVDFEARLEKEIEDIKAKAESTNWFIKLFQMIAKLFQK